MTLYAERDQLIADYLQEVGTNPAKLAALDRILLSVTAAIDSYCKRPTQYFAPADTQPSQRLFFGEGKNALRLPVHVAGSIDPSDGVDCAGHPITNWVEIQGWLYLTCGFKARRSVAERRAVSRNRTLGLRSDAV